MPEVQKVRVEILRTVVFLLSREEFGGGIFGGTVTFGIGFPVVTAPDAKFPALSRAKPE